MEVENFDDLWDKLIEAHEQMTLGDYFARVHSLCFHIRLWEERISVADCRREAFMADAIRSAQADGLKRILVVTGGFHSSALAARLAGLACPGLDTPAMAAPGKRPTV